MVLVDMAELAEHRLYHKLLDLLINMHTEVLVEHMHQITDMVTLLITGMETMDQDLMERITHPQIIMEQGHKEW